MKICRVSFSPITQIFERIPQRDRHLLSRLKRRGHDVHELRVAPAWRPLAIRLSYLVGFLRTIPDLSRVKPDLILADGLEAGLVGWITARAKRISFVFDYRDHYSFLYRQKHGSRHPVAVQVLEQWLPRVADLVITADGRQKRASLAAGAATDRVRLIPNGVDPDRFTPGPKDPALLAEWGLANRPAILYVGKVTPAFNLPMVVEAMREVVQQYPEASLLVVGDGTALPHLKRLSREMGLGTHVVFAGCRPYSEIPAFIRSSDVCIYPLRSVAALSILEYMACGKPVVIPNADYDLSLPEGCCFPVAKSPEGFAEGITRLLGDPGLASDLSRKAREVVESEFNWDHLALTYESALRECVTRYSGAGPKRSGSRDGHGI
jgi:glycosyltransferase involved in cell wall biosynthesis